MCAWEFTCLVFNDQICLPYFHMTNTQQVIFALPHSTSSDGFWRFNKARGCAWEVLLIRLFYVKHFLIYNTCTRLSHLYFSSLQTSSNDFWSSRTHLYISSPWLAKLLDDKTVGDVSSRDGRDGRYVIALGGFFCGDVEFFGDFCGRKSATTGDAATPHCGVEDSTISSRRVLLVPKVII